MYRIHFFSDPHDDHAGNRIERLPAVDSDFVVVAGDLMQPGHHAIRRLRQLFPDPGMNIIYVPGNHDYYSHFDKKNPDSGTRTTIEEQRFHLMPRAAQEEGIILLDDGQIELTNRDGDSVVILGATGWTDMRCSPSWMTRADVMRESARRMNDYRCIKTGDGRSKDRLTPADTIEMHKESVEFIAKCLEDHAGRDVVVVTHHAPSPRSLVGYDPARPDKFGDMDWCYASELLENGGPLAHLMTGDTAPRMWLHGHIHSSRDYVVGDDVRVIANPRGYALWGRRENPHFNPALVLEIEPRYVPTVKL